MQLDGMNRIYFREIASERSGEIPLDRPRHEDVRVEKEIKCPLTLPTAKALLPIIAAKLCTSDRAIRKKKSAAVVTQY